MPSQSNGHRPLVHVILQAKGGVGKSYVAAIVAQYYRDKQYAVRCFDTDPGNATLTQYKALDVEHIGDLIQGGVINQKRFDPLVEKLRRFSRLTHPYYPRMTQLSGQAAVSRRPYFSEE
jgi:cellulose biosynthesis protein BcsQ